MFELPPGHWRLCQVDKLVGGQFPSVFTLSVHPNTTLFMASRYCLASQSIGSTNFYSTFEAELDGIIPVIQTSIGGTRIIGRLTAGAFWINTLSILC